MFLRIYEIDLLVAAAPNNAFFFEAAREIVVNGLLPGSADSERGFRLGAFVGSGCPELLVLSGVSC